MRPVTRRRAFTVLELSLVMALVAVLAAILFPVFAQARQASHKSRCQAQLFQIGMALQLYARDHNGGLPPRHNDFGPVMRNYLPELSALECGSDAIAPWVRKANEAASKTARTYASYQYRGGLASDDPPDIPVAADWTTLHQGSANVLMLSGSVKAISPPHLPATSFGPRVLPPGAAVPSMDAPTPFLNDPPMKKSGSTAPAPSGGGA